MLIHLQRTEVSENEALWLSYSEDQEDCERWWVIEDKDWENSWENKEESKEKKIIITENQEKNKKYIYNFYKICSSIYYFFSQRLNHSWFQSHYSCI